MADNQPSDSFTPHVTNEDDSSVSTMTTPAAAAAASSTSTSMDEAAQASASSLTVPGPSASSPKTPSTATTAPPTNTVKRGHAPQPSVGIAASLFGSAGDDDPFSSIAAADDGVGSNSFAATTLNQLSEVEEEQEDPFGTTGSGVSKGNDSAAAIDPIPQLFGGEPEAHSQSQAEGSRLSVPTHSGSSNQPASGPASPGELFANSPYEDDWLGAANQDTNATPAEDLQASGNDPFDTAQGGQGSLSWLNDADQPDAGADVGFENGQELQTYDGQQYDAYGRPIGALGDYDGAQYDQQGYGADQAQSYEQHGYADQGQTYQNDQYANYDYPAQQLPAAAEGQDYDPHTYSHDPLQQYQQHDPNGYYSTSDNTAYQYDSSYQPADTSADAQYHHYDAHYGQSSSAYEPNSNQGQYAPPQTQTYDPYSPYAAQGSVSNQDQQQQQQVDPNGFYGYTPTADGQDQSQNAYYGAVSSIGAAANGQNQYTDNYATQYDGQYVTPPQPASQFRATSPYDPPAATSAYSAPPPNAVSSIGPPQKNQSLPPPPKGPPRGSSRNASRDASRQSPLLSETLPPASSTTSTSAISLEQENREAHSNWHASNPHAAATDHNANQWSYQQHPEDHQKKAPQQAEQNQMLEQGVQAWTAGDGHQQIKPANSWIDSLEQAAATPPSSADDSLPILTVTDESHEGYDAYQHDGVDPEGGAGDYDLHSEEHTPHQHEQNRDAGDSTAEDTADALSKLSVAEPPNDPATPQHELDERVSSDHAAHLILGDLDSTSKNTKGSALDQAFESKTPEEMAGGLGVGNGDEDTYNQDDGRNGHLAQHYSPYAPLDQLKQPTGSVDGNASYDSNVSYGYGAFETTHQESFDPSTTDPYARPPQSMLGDHQTESSSQYDMYQAGAVANSHPGQERDDEESDARTPMASYDQSGSWLDYSQGQGHLGTAVGDGAASEDPYAPSSSDHQRGLPSSSQLNQQLPNAAATHEDPYGLPSSGAIRQDGPAPNLHPIDVQPALKEHDQGYFDEGMHQSSPQTYAYGSTYGVPASPYDPNAGARSVTDETNSQAASEATSDMLQTMRNAKIPLACFGIGGKLVTYFPSGSMPNGDGGSGAAYGSYSYNASSHPTQVKLQSLSSLVPSSSYASAFDPLTFPGPVFEGASTTNALSRATGGASASKAKKVAIVKYLEERVKDLSAGVGYLRRRPSFSGSSAGGSDRNGASDSESELEARRVEDKVVLLQLLKLLVENDGQTTTPAFEQGVRSLIVAEKSDESLPSGFGTTPVAMTSTGAGANGQVVTSYELRTDFLQKVQAMLLRGERREAVEYAVANKMWAHAMTISSCVDKDCWKVVVSQFIEHELGLAESSTNGAAADLQGLKVAYNVFSGQDPVSIFDLFRTKTQFSQTGGSLRPAGDPNALTSHASLPSWKESAAIVATNKSASDAAALTAIGDGLSTRGLLEAAHFCYLLSPQTSPMGGVDANAVRFILLGTGSPKESSAYTRDLDGILMTEILEYAQGLVPVAKGQEPYSGIPHLQAYKLIHAYTLAELGDVVRAQKYCETIAHGLKQSKRSPYLHAVLLAQLKQLSDRLVAAPQQGPGGNWVTRKMQRPTLDGVWGALEGRFTKFIAGEDGVSDAGSPNKNSKGSVSSSIGPFSHYTAITPDAASGGMTRQQSFNDMRGSGSMPNSRSGSAMGFRGSAKRAASPGLRASSALSMRPISSDPYSDWPRSGASQLGNASYQPNSGQDGASLGPGSSRTSSEAHRQFGHGFQSSEYSAMSSTYEGPGETSYTSEHAPWYGGNAATGADDSQRPSSEVQDQDRDSNAGGGYDGGYSDTYAGYGGYGQGANDDAGDGSIAPNDTPYYGYQPHGAQQPQFVSNVDGAGALEADEGGFVSPFDALSSSSNSRTPQPRSNSYDPQPQQQQHGASQYAREDEADEEDDLGLGNASSRKKQQDANGTVNDDRYAPGDDFRRDSVSTSTSGAVDKEDKKDESKPAGGEEKRQELKSSASWFGRLWGRSPSTEPSQSQSQAQSKAKKAHLGEEVTFYYDKELKRWVNKKAGDAGGAASTPPPPPPPARAQSASPASHPDRSAGTASAPPMRRIVSSDVSPGGNRAPPSGPGTRGASGSYSTMGRSTPPISEGQDEGSSGLGANRGPPGSGGLTRARSNLADLSMPPAAQPGMNRSGAATPSSTGVGSPPPPPAPPGGSRTGTVKKRPIKSRYVVVD